MTRCFGIDGIGQAMAVTESDFFKQKMERYQKIFQNNERMWCAPFLVTITYLSIYIDSSTFFLSPICLNTVCMPSWTRKPKCRNAEALGVLMASLVDAGGYGDPQYPRHGQWHPCDILQLSQVTSTSLWTTVIWTTLPWTHLAMSLAQCTWDEATSQVHQKKSAGTPSCRRCPVFKFWAYTVYLSDPFRTTYTRVTKTASSCCLAVVFFWACCCCCCCLDTRKSITCLLGPHTIIRPSNRICMDL